MTDTRDVRALVERIRREGVGSSGGVSLHVGWRPMGPYPQPGDIVDAQMVLDLAKFALAADTRATEVERERDHWREARRACLEGGDELKRQLAHMEARIAELTAALELSRGAMAAQEERETQAGALCGVPREESGCDWPDRVAEVLVTSQQRIAELTAALEYAKEHIRMDASNQLCDGSDSCWYCYCAKAIARIDAALVGKTEPA